MIPSVWHNGRVEIIEHLCAPAWSGIADWALIPSTLLLRQLSGWQCARHVSFWQFWRRTAPNTSCDPPAFLSTFPSSSQIVDFPGCHPPPRSITGGVAVYPQRYFMESTFAKADGATLKKAENEVAAVLFHLRKLLRLKNRLRSPLLWLPTETIIHILSYIMKDMEYSSVWRSIFSTCHHIHWIMRTATELWWKVDCTWTRVAHIAFVRSKGNPEAIVADLHTWDYWRNEKARKALDHWRDKWVLHGHRLHALELCGEPSDIVHFSWIFERPLPRLHHLKIHFFRPLDDDENELPLPDPVALQIPTDLPLRVLDLRNATLPWSSNLFAGLSELHVDFRDCDAVVDISADELLGIFDVSPRLERLSLLRVCPRTPVGNGEPQYPPTRLVQLPNLAFLKLDNSPVFISNILIHVRIPAIDSLEIRSHVLPHEVPSSLRFFSLNCRPFERLFSTPPVFAIGATNEDGPPDSMNIAIGGFKMRFDIDIDTEEIVRQNIAACVPPLVPSSVAILELDDLQFDEQEWREFFRSRQEVRSIECSKSSRKPAPESLWEALSPGTDAVPLCPKLESMSLFENPVSAPLLNCLLNRKDAGFRLRHLRFSELDDAVAEELRPLVGELRASSTQGDLREIVRPVSMYELNCVLTETP